MNQRNAFYQVLLAGIVLECLYPAFVSETLAQDTTHSPPQTESKAQFDRFSLEFDGLFPEAIKYWSSREKQLVRGLIQGNALRKKLLANDAEGVSYCRRFGDAVAQFQHGSKIPLRARKPISGFSLSTERLQGQLQGREKLSADSFTAFDGRWFGQWGKDDVNHDWQPTQKFPEPKRYRNSDLQVHGLQYAWISNGFGWNYLVTPERQEANSLGHPFVLGMVYYFDGDDFETIRGEKAHVGFVDSPTRLIWLTEREIFLEEVFPHAEPEKTVYAITALYHDLFSAHRTVSDRATQAVYTRSPNERPDFFEFRWR